MPSVTEELRNTIASHVQNVNNAFIMKNHGALIFGSTMERAVHNVAIFGEMLAGLSAGPLH